MVEYGGRGPIYNHQGMPIDVCLIDEEAVMKVSPIIEFICLAAPLPLEGVHRKSHYPFHTKRKRSAVADFMA